MWKITKGYKEGRAVMYYDLVDALDGTKKEKIHKDEVVKLAESGQVTNTKIQWWEGKAIVRCSDTFDIIKLGSAGEVIGQVGTVKRVQKNIKENVPSDVSDKAVVVGKLSKRRKESVAYGGYDRQLEIDQFQEQSSINYKDIDTVGALFMMIAKEYNLKYTDKYFAEFSKKVNPDRKIASMARNTLLSIQDSISTYLMNMAHKEIQETWVKYRVKAV